jgi:small subunit ribosomal protein S14
MPNIRLLRDMKARNVVKSTEVLRRAYLYVARNETLPAHVRHQAQLQLNTFSKYSRPTTVKNRCHESGRGRGIIGEFALSRVRLLVRVSLLDALTFAPVPLPPSRSPSGTPRCPEGFMVVHVLYTLFPPLAQLSSRPSHK